MKLSLRWLADHVDLSGIAPDEIARQLTMKTALIEGIEWRGKGLEQVRVGHVVHREKHPNADRLSFCKVDTGKEVLEVVCGAPNVAAGQRIAYAPVGCTLPNGLTLEARKIRGITSNGMICSQKELGLGEDHDGIMVLPDDAPLGKPIAEVLGLDDVIFEIDNKSITHRADLWGHYGFARELSGIFERPLKPLSINSALRADPASFALRLDDPTGCPLYLALRAEFDALPATPSWMARRLEAVGMRPISLLVDLSNYVMLEIGQPTHPFDEDRLQGRRIVVRRGAAGEKMKTLDGQTRELTTEDLVIADGAHAVAIAGVMGGGETEVSEATRHLLLESASFEAPRVRKTAARLALRTEAVARFEKTLDTALPELALRRYAYLLLTLAPAVKLETRFAAAGGAHPRTPAIKLRPARARAKLGYDLTDDEMAKRLRSIGFEVREDGGEFVVTVPSFRSRRDVTVEDDLIEEVGRLAGYERVPATLPRFPATPPTAAPLRRVEREVVRSFVHECGYAETMGYSFATDRQVALFHEGASGGERPFVRLVNSLTTDATRLRRSLVPSLLDALATNLVERGDVRLVESGREYLPELPSQATEGLPGERAVVAAVRALRGADPEGVLLESRGDVETCLARLHVAFEGRRPQGELPAFAHPGRAIELVAIGPSGDARPVGLIAQLHPELARRFRIADPAAVMELDLALLAESPRPAARMQPIPQFPPTRRDLAVVAPDERTVAEIEREVRAVGGDRLARVELFDVYRGEKIAGGHRSLAFRLEYRAPDRTLTDEEVDRLHASVVARLERQGIKLRA
jgi:phenylalanyl-tRNA synthetase beta chain